MEVIVNSERWLLQEVYRSTMLLLAIVGTFFEREWQVHWIPEQTRCFQHNGDAVYVLGR